MSNQAIPVGGKISTLQFFHGTRMLIMGNRMEPLNSFMDTISHMLRSGTTWTEICTEMMKIDRGTIHFLAVWEDETVSGFSVEDGKIIERHITLGDPVT